MAKRRQPDYAEEVLNVWLERSFVKLGKELGPEQATSLLLDLSNALPNEVKGEKLKAGQVLTIALALGFWAKFQMNGGLDFLEN